MHVLGIGFWQFWWIEGDLFSVWFFQRYFWAKLWYILGLSSVPNLKSCVFEEVSNLPMLTTCQFVRPGRWLGWRFRSGLGLDSLVRNVGPVCRLQFLAEHPFTLSHGFAVNFEHFRNPACCIALIATSEIPSHRDFWLATLLEYHGVSLWQLFVCKQTS